MLQTVIIACYTILFRRIEYENKNALMI